MKIDNDDFVGIDCGDGMIDLADAAEGKMPVELRPVQLYFKNNGARNDKPSFTIVMVNPALPVFVYGQVSLAMMTKALESVGYKLYPLKKV